MDILALKPISSIAAPAEQTVERPRSDVPSVPAGAGKEPPPVRDLGQTLRAVAEQLSEYLRSSNRNLEFRVDGEAGTTVITVRDASSGEVIRQIPNEEVLRMMRRLNEDSGTLLDLMA